MPELDPLHIPHIPLRIEPDPPTEAELALRVEVDLLRQEILHRDEEREVYRDRFTMVSSMSISLPSSGNPNPEGIVTQTHTISQEEREEFIRQQQERRVQEHNRKIEQQKALEKALGLLETKIGPEATANINNGGAYPVRSKLWPDVVYYVPKNPHEKIKVMCNGTKIMESCLVSTGFDLPWPDIMLQRITALEIDESVVVETGVVHQVASQGWMDRQVRRLTRMLR